MKIKLFYLIGLVSLMAFGFLACTKKQTGVSSDLQVNGDSANVQVDSKQGGMSGAKSAGGKVFRGSIGDKKIEMTLRREGDQLSGTYLYRRIGSDIALKGSLDKQGKFTLQEFDNSGKQTGEFKGKWDEPANLPTATLEGTWAKPGSDQTLSFYMTEQAIEFTNGLRVLQREIKEEDKKKKYWVEAEYPELTGAANQGADKFNAEVKRLITKETQEFKQNESEIGADDLPAETSNSFIDISYDVVLATDNLISVMFGVSTYSRGAAHPNYSTSVVNYDLKSGASLKLADLFKPGSDYLEAISRFCMDVLKKQAAAIDAPTETIDEGASPNPDNYQSWNISKKGLAVNFDPYQVASYAEGPKNVIVPYSVLKEMIKPDGPLAAVANK